MKATLTIEVPNDFGKGQCNKCRLREELNNGMPFYQVVGCKAMNKAPCTDNCPLEIQDEFTELEQKCLKHIGELIVENATLKENEQ